LSRIPNYEPYPGDYQDFAFRSPLSRILFEVKGLVLPPLDFCPSFGAFFSSLHFFGWKALRVAPPGVRGRRLFAVPLRNSGAPQDTKHGPLFFLVLSHFLPVFFQVPFGCPWYIGQRPFAALPSLCFLADRLLSLSFFPPAFRTPWALGRNVSKLFSTWLLLLNGVPFSQCRVFRHEEQLFSFGFRPLFRG